MRNTSLLRLLVAAVIVALATGCSFVADTSTDADGIAARGIADSVADPATGTMQEMADLGSCFFGHWGHGPKPWQLFHEPNFGLFLRDGFLSKKLVWAPENNDYEMTETRSVTAGPVDGTASTLSIAVAFFTTSDASGTGVQVSPLTEGATAFSDIHSLTYNRRMQGIFANNRSGLLHQNDTTSSYVVTDLIVDGSSPGFTVNGGKTRTFTNTHPDGTTVEGTLTEKITTPVVVTAVLQSDGSYLVSTTGIIQVDYNATITRADGTTETVSRTATITLDGERIVHIRMGKMHFRADMTTGEIEQEK